MAESRGLFKEQTVSQALQSVLNKHGHGFQYRVLEHCLADRPTGSIPHKRWQFAIDEFPVELNDKPTHVDFILGLGTHLLVAECKRVRGGRWGFARAKLSRAATERPVADFLSIGGTTLDRQVHAFGPSTRSPFHIAVEMQDNVPQRDGEHPAEPKKEPKAFETAVAEVLRARGGLMEFLGRHTLRYGGGAVVPVIFTTAELVTTPNDLGESVLETGNVADSLAVESVDWLWYNTNLSRAMRPSIKRRPGPPEGQIVKTVALLRSLRMDMTRSIAIVRPAGITAFLRDLAIDLARDSEPITQSS